MLKEIELDKIRFGSNVNLIDQQLKESIESIGLLQPPVLRPVGDGYYEILNGWSRLRACRDLGWLSVKCLVVVMSDSEVELNRIVESVKNVKTKPVEYARQLRRILDINTELTVEDLAVKINKTTRWVNQQLSLNNLTSFCAALVDEERICLGNAYILASLPQPRQSCYVSEAQVMYTENFRRLVLSKEIL